MDIDWIQGDKFIGVADFSYAPSKGARDDYNKLRNTLKEIRGIIYTHTMYIPDLFELIRKFPTTLTEYELSDGRVNVKHIDGRLFLKMTKNKYDSTGFWEKAVGLIVMVAGAYLILVGFFPVIIIGLCIYLSTAGEITVAFII